MKDHKVSFLPLLFLFIQPIFMTGNIAVARGAAGLVPPVSLAFWRWVLAALILLPFIFPSLKKQWKDVLVELPKLLALGLTGFAFCGAFPYISGLTTSVVNMGIIYSASPIFIILFSVFIYKEKLSKLQIFGTILCLSGIMIVVCKGQLETLMRLQFTKGDIWISGAMISWAVYSVFLMNWKSKFDLLTRFGLMAIAGVICLLPMYYIEETFFYTTSFNKDFVFWTVIAAIFPGIIAFLMYSKLQKFVGASITGLVVYLMPIYSALYGYFLFNEKLQSFHWFGGLFVLTGIILANKNLFKIK
ncbi:MAG: DMT family transporter [Proteobacteria bacterium]|uniref:DMT family transporter n=1 Tax=Candidatus Fonsibacter lacus TaxID=2576439 RepID=A0A964V0S6_9PROT|nr:DMT family transporter [Candidatus Fonsibacter lacus]NCU53329.1 DMT family transporter [Candidatus Fonsibacter lacus]NCU71871.1 DMT family transporter [Candidatus Fonsibacter lacus]